MSFPKEGKDLVFWVVSCNRYAKTISLFSFKDISSGFKRMIPSYIQDFVDFAVEKAFQEALRSMQGAPGMGTLHRFSKRSCMQRCFIRITAEFFF